MKWTILAWISSYKYSIIIFLMNLFFVSLYSHKCWMFVEIHTYTCKCKIFEVNNYFSHEQILNGRLMLHLKDESNELHCKESIELLRNEFIELHCNKFDELHSNKSTEFILWMILSQLLSPLIYTHILFR